ncbi:MAG: lipopolysaccharide biosynthesis [Cyanobacteriota bacterium]|nr:lipopolysaccharide biosynthesis [Cyanobacteriota bacterium]
MAPSIVKRYLIAFGKYKIAGFAFLAISVGGAAVFGLQDPPPPTYVGRGVLTLNQYPATLSSTGGEIQATGASLLTKDFLLDQNIINIAAEQAKLSPDRIRSSAWVSLPVEGEPPIYRVGYRDDSPERAEAVAKMLVEGMVEKSRFVNTRRVQSIADALNERLPEVKAELEAAEGELVQFEKVEGAAITMAINGNLVGQIAGSQEQQRQLQLNLETVDAQIRSLEERLGLTPSEAYAASALSADPLIAQLRVQIYQLENQMAVESQNFRPEHPQMQELNRQLGAYEQQLAQRYLEVIGGDGIAAAIPSSARIRQDSSLDPARQELARQLVGLQTQRETIIQQLSSAERNEQQLTEEFVTIPNKQMERERLAKQVALKSALYDQLQARLVDTEAAKAETVSSLNAGEVNVDTESTPPQNMLLLLAIGSGVGLVGGAAVIYLLSALEGRFYTFEEVRGALQEQDVPILGTIPTLYPLSMETEQMPVAIEPHSPYLEFYERLRSNLRRLGEDPPKMVLMTSAGSQEGKTFSAYNLAIASARAGKRTLLIEADLRSPSCATALKVAPDPALTVEPQRYYGQLDCTRLVPDVENLYIVPSAGPQQHAAAILESSEMRQLLKDARSRFDFIVLDTPSLRRCNDALLLEPHTDGIILVTRPGETQGSLLTENVELLEETEEIEFLGAIVNDAEIPVNLPPEIFDRQDNDREVAFAPTSPTNGTDPLYPQSEHPEAYPKAEVPSGRR